ATTNVKMNTTDATNYYNRATMTPSTSAGVNATTIAMVAQSYQTSGEFAFRSTHAGGCNFLFCDGTVKFIRDTIAFNTNPTNPGVYQKLGSRTGGEVIDGDSY